MSRVQGMRQRTIAWLARSKWPVVDSFVEPSTRPYASRLREGQRSHDAGVLVIRRFVAGIGGIPGQEGHARPRLRSQCRSVSDASDITQTPPRQT